MHVMTDSDGTTYPKTLAALRDQEDRSWAVADALVDEIETHPSGQVFDGEYARCSSWLASQGYEVTADYLRRMRSTAVTFPRSTTMDSESIVVDLRRWKVPFRLYVEAAKSAKWSPDLMDEAEREHWTLRDFSQKLTGNRWADDDIEAAKRVLRDPEKLAEAAGEIQPEEAASAAEGLTRRAWQTAANPPAPIRRLPPPTDEPAEDPELDARIREAGAKSPLAHDSLGPPMGIALDLIEIRNRLGRIYVAATDPRIDWGEMGGSTADSLRAIGTQSFGIADILTGGSATLSDADLEEFLKDAG